MTLRVCAPVVLVLVAGCASNPGIVPAGGDVLMLARSGYGLGESQANVSAKIHKEAAEHCAAMGRTMEVVFTDSKRGPDSS